VLYPRTMTISGDTVIAERGSCTDTEVHEVTMQMRH